MSLKVDKVQLEIIMKSDTTRAEIMKLEDSAKSLQKQMKGMKKDSEEYARTSGEYKKVRDQIDALRGSIALTGKTMRELSNRSKELRAMLNNLTPGSDQWRRYDTELREVNNRMRELRGQAQQTESGFSKLAGGFNKYFGMAGVMVASVTGLSLTFRKLAEDVAKMDDVYSDVMKTTGMTRDEVLGLNEELKKMDTRTAREELNNLARDAGKLGLTTKQDILDFVEAGNQINVALGEDLGDDAIKNIGKIVGVFERSTEHLQQLGLKDQMLSVGSAINELGASSSASEPYLVQFAGRLGGIATQAGLSIDQILGFGSALDQDMQAVEMSATALQNFIMKIMGDPAKFAKIAGMEVSKFSALMNTDMNGAIKAVLRSMNESGGLQQLVPLFKDMGLDGARAAQVISAMAGGIDKIDTAQAVANASLREGVSLTNEYNIKNNNLAAQLEKARKNFKEVSLELGQSLNPLLLKSTNATNYLIRGLVELGRNWDKIGKALLIVGGYVAAYNAQQLTQNLLLKEGIGLKVKELVLKAKDEVVLRGLILQEALHAATKDKTTLATKGAAVAQVIWNTAIKANPIGLLIGALTTVTAALMVWNRTKSTAVDLEKAHASINEETVKNTRAEVNELDRLKKTLYDSSKSYDERNRALTRIKEIVPEYLGQLTSENKLIYDNADALDVYAKKLVLTEKIKIATRKQGEEEDKFSEFLSGNKDITKQYVKAMNEANEMVRSGAVANLEEGMKRTLRGAGMKAYQLMVKEYGNNISTYGKMIEGYTSDLGKVQASGSRPAGGGSGGSSGAGDGGIGGSGSVGKKPEMDAATVWEAYNKELEGVEAAHQAVMLQMLTDYRNGKYEDEAAWQATLKQQELDYLGEKIGVQRKWATESEDVKKALVDTEIALENKRIAGQKSADEQVLDQLKASNEARLGALAALDAAEREQLQAKLDSGELTQREYASALLALDSSTAGERRQTAEAYLAWVKEAEFATGEAKKKALDEATKAVEKATSDEKSVVEKGKADKLKIDEEYQKQREGILNEYGLVSIREQYDKELEALKQHLKDKLISEEEYERAKDKLGLDNAVAYAERAVKFAGYAADAVSAYHKQEADSLEAAKQRELTAAGDNAEARAQIEKNYAQKELDLKKKQANADAGIKIAQTLSAGALAAIQAFAQLGPIGGAIAAVMIATTTAFQVSSIMKQRQAILATTLDSSASGGSDSAGARVGNSQQASEPAKVRQRASGSWDVVGADDGRTYRGVKYGGSARTGVVSAPTLMGERGDELIVDNPTLRNIRMNAPHLIGEMLRYRVPQRAGGNYGAVSAESSGGQGTIAENTEVMRELARLLRWLQENRIEAYMVFSEAEKQRALYNKSAQHGSL